MPGEFRKPPKGYKNIDLAIKQFMKLQSSVNSCSTDTSALTYSSTRWLENAFYGREITEEEYDSRMDVIKEQTRIFIEKCNCRR